ncbi:MAG: LLM class flavin-dependent oxidoreductase [Chloroflexi bacterium]|nr:LLM class flavin-dependent oxidoreductase [Chloroflexota bacterium]
MPSIDVFMMQDLEYQAYMESAKLAEKSGFENFWLIDSTDAYTDYCAWDSLIAVNTSRIRIGPGVTNPITRHPRVTANHMLTLNELSKGRAILGLGTGDNAVRSMGWSPVSHSVMREAMEIIRNKFRERRADIPIYVAIGGPLNTKMALQLADGVIGGVGLREGPDGLIRGLERLKAAAKEAGRDFSNLPVKLNYGFAISHNRKEAIEEMRWSVSTLMRGIFVRGTSALPTHLERFREEAKRIGESYDYFNHMRTHTLGGQLARHSLASDELVEAVGLPAGTPEDFLPRFKSLWQAISPMPNVGFFLVPHGDKGGRKRTLELFVREVLPKLG